MFSTTRKYVWGIGSVAIVENLQWGERNPFVAIETQHFQVPIPIYTSHVCWVLVRPIFGYCLAELGNFQNLMIFIRRIDFTKRQERQLEGFIIKKWLWPLTNSSPFVIIRRRQARSREAIFKCRIIHSLYSSAIGFSSIKSQWLSLSVISLSPGRRAIDRGELSDSVVGNITFEYEWSIILMSNSHVSVWCDSVGYKRLWYSWSRQCQGKSSWVELSS